ncbi:MAG: ABC transporter permease [Gammaproteobacteria bacterium]|nr:ABC transporter permease [Gammaproteobacteria bacterium]
MAPRWVWRLLSAPGLLFLAVFFLVAFYAVVAVGLGNVTTQFQPVPHWNPLDWNVGYLREALSNLAPGGQMWPVVVRTVLYIAVAMALTLLIGYPVAYYAARCAGRWSGLILALLVLPFWISYIMRLLAWTNLLASDGYASEALNALGVDRLFNTLGLMEGDDWLGGQPVTVIIALVYGYVPFFILPLYASLNRLDQRLIETSRDLGASAAETFRRVILPLSRPGIYAGMVLIALPMFGDYFTQDLMSGSPNTNMVGNIINGYVQGGPDKSLGAAMTMLLSAFLLIFMAFYLRSLRREQREAE